MISLDLLGLVESEASNNTIESIIIAIDVFDGGVIVMDRHLVREDLGE